MDIISKEEFYCTLLHEFVHMKKYLLSGEIGTEKEVESLERKILEENPGIVFFIIDFYGIKVPKRLK
jgi:hypothetical protein